TTPSGVGDARKLEQKPKNQEGQSQKVTAEKGEQQSTEGRQGKPPPKPCYYCNGWHWNRDCPTRPPENAESAPHAYKTRSQDVPQKASAKQAAAVSEPLNYAAMLDELKRLRSESAQVDAAATEGNPLVGPQLTSKVTVNGIGTRALF